MISLKHPFTCLVAGPTGSGKTVLVRRILKENRKLISNLESRSPRVLWCYGISQELYHHKIPGCTIEYNEGISEEIILEKRPDILIIDDLMQEKSSDSSLANIFTRGSHHLGMSVIFIVQNIFAKGSQMRTISLNAKYILLLKNPRDKSQIYSLGRQLFPHKSTFFTESYEDATKQPHGYLLIDLSQDCDDQYRVRSNIFDKYPTIYIPK